MVMIPVGHHVGAGRRSWFGYAGRLREAWLNLCLVAL